MAAPDPVRDSDLPIREVLDDLRRGLAEERGAVLSAPPGSGKTTLVPLALLEEEWLDGRSILMLEPRRLAARAAAARMAYLLGERVGQQAGYRIRFDQQVSRHTRIEVLTEGILTRRLQSDPELQGVGLVIFDEFHERSLHADLALALTLDVRGALRPDLRVLIMSATLDSQAAADLAGGVPCIEGGGQLHPVDVRYAPRPRGESIQAGALAGIRTALKETSGDLLVFLPGAGEIRGTASGLEDEEGASDLEIHPLYGNLPQQAQDAAVRPDPRGRRKVVLATNIAETSLTIEGVSTVVDSGWERTPKFDPNSGLTRLETVRISQASARQRSGRAGRLGPGVCYRLWSRGRQAALLPFAPPEIRDADLAPLALQLAQWGVGDPRELRWLDPPPQGAFQQARELLGELEALDSRGRLTRQGNLMARLPLHPRLAALLLEARDRGCLRLGVDVAALLSERDPLRGARGDGPVPCDLEERLSLLRALRKGGARQVRQRGGDPAACAAAARVSRQLQDLLRSSPGPDRNTAQEVHPGWLLSCAYPDRIAQRRPGSHHRYLLANGREAALPQGDLLASHRYLAVASLDAGKSSGRIYTAAALSEDDLRSRHGGRVRRRQRVEWEVRSQSVAAYREETLRQLTLSRKPLHDPDPLQVQEALLQGVRQAGLDCLPWSEKLRQWQARVLSLADWRPQEGWPDVSDQALVDSLEDWLLPFLAGLSSFSDLRRLDLQAALDSRLGSEKQKRLKEGAPTHLEVPSGSHLRLRYQPPDPPVLAVRLQEMFGLADTPAVCWGEVPVLLHLLSPAQRPVQVTQDLKGFWDRTYPEVKRELAGRYPKHHWPEDPWSASATRHPKRRRK
ncbi:MAG TPA: ATP-dependent helicase HrpB [Acidobacteriota bacterium]|nr:ATP-dependent helicase HrpB [Acidobacteriota bacterium]